MKFESFLAWRYLSTKNKPLFVSLLSIISLIAMAVSVFALILVLAVMRGFERDFQKKVVGFKAPLVVTSSFFQDWKKLVEEMRKSFPDLKAPEPYLEGEAILETEEGQVAGVRIRGGKTREPLEGSEALVGRELSYSLGLFPELEEKVSLTFPFGEVGPTGELLPRRRSYEVRDTFRTGFYEYDSKYLLLSLAEAELLLGEHGRGEIEIWVDIDQAPRIKNQIQSWAIDQKLTVMTWQEQNPKLFTALKLERIGMFILLGVLLLVSSMTIFGLISLNVMEKIVDMAILRSIGLVNSRVRKIFLLKAFLIGCVGDLLGGGLAVTAVFYLGWHPVRLPTSYYVEYLPVLWDPWITLGVLCGAPLVALLAALYPARRSTVETPAEVLRYE